MLVLKNINDLNFKQWNEFVENHALGNFFQSPYFFNIHKNEYNTYPFGYAAFSNEKILGLIIAITYKNLFFPLNIFTERTIVMGGPLVLEKIHNEIDIYNLLLDSIKKDKNVGIYIQIRNLFDVSRCKNLFENNKYKYEDHLDILHNLKESEDIIWSKINKNKRGNINKSKNKGTTFKEITLDVDLNKANSLIQSTYKKVGLPVPSVHYFENARKYLNNDMLKYFGAFDNEKLIGVRVELIYKECIYDWFAGADMNYNNRYPNDFLPYSIIIWGKQNNLNVFDFGGAGHPNKPYGVREHKLKFGGELVNYGRFELVVKPTMMFISKIAFYLFKIIIKKK